MSQIKTVNMQSVSPDRISLFPGIPHGRIYGKSGRRNDRGAGAQHHERGLITDLYARAGEQSDLTVKRRCLKTLAVIQVAAFFAQRIIEKVQGRVFLLAHIAIARCVYSPPALLPAGGIVVYPGRRLERRIHARAADAGGISHTPVVLEKLQAPGLFCRLIPSFRFSSVGAGYLTGRFYKSDPLLFRKGKEVSGLSCEIIKH